MDGWNNNPNVLQLKYPLRGNLQKNGIKPSKNINCVDRDVCDEVSGPSRIPSKLSEFFKFLEKPTIIHNDALFYISGFISKKLGKSVKCAECRNSFLHKATDY